MTKKQQELYDKTCIAIQEQLGSCNAIAIRSYLITDEVVSGETVRIWIRERRIPADFVFVLYEMAEKSFDPLVLLPWLRKWVTLKTT